MDNQISDKFLTADFYKHPVQNPRTIDKLEISDCVEIIVNDLARYGVPESLAMEMIFDYFFPLKKAADAAKKQYSDVAFKDLPDTAFF